MPQFPLSAELRAALDREPQPAPPKDQVYSFLDARARLLDWFAARFPATEREAWQAVLDGHRGEVFGGPFFEEHGGIGIEIDRDDPHGDALYILPENRHSAFVLSTLHPFPEPEHVAPWSWARVRGPEDLREALDLWDKGEPFPERVDRCELFDSPADRAQRAVKATNERRRLFERSTAAPTRLERIAVEVYTRRAQRYHLEGLSPDNLNAEADAALDAARALCFALDRSGLRAA